MSTYRKVVECRVEVTAADIASGRRGSPWRCPIARAINRMFRLDPDGPISRGGACVSGKTVRFQGQTWVWPAAVDEFVDRYDSDLPVEPFTFELAREIKESP